MPPTTDRPLDILLAASEVVGFAKTGGLADVAGSLPRALARRGHRCRIILPLYRCVRDRGVPLEPIGHPFTVPVGGGTVVGRLMMTRWTDPDVTIYFVEQPDYFERDDPQRGTGLYHLTAPDGSRRDYPDNCERFVFFSRAVLETCRLLDDWPDILHANDWQTGLVPVYLEEEWRKRGGGCSGNKAVHTRSVFTVHNLAYQGLFWAIDMQLTGLPGYLFNPAQLEFHNHLNLLKSGIVFADAVTTVSPTYAREIQTPYFGCGLQGVLYERRHQLSGIVNGVDYAVWNPATDRTLPAHYDVESVEKGKAACKAALQRHFQLAESPRAPLLGVIARLVEQKGVNLILEASESILAGDTQLVVLGEGDPTYHRGLEALRSHYPNRVGLLLGFDETLAHRIEAGADAFLMPSQYEPSGLNQLYSMKYGTPPIVRATGGLADTVVDCTPQTLAEDRATGFAFVPPTPAALAETVARALDLYRRRPTDWLKVVRCGMRQDWSWDRSAAEYEALYRRLTGGGG